MKGLFGGQIASAPEIVRFVPTGPKTPSDSPDTPPLQASYDFLERAAWPALIGSATRSGALPHNSDPVDRRLALAESGTVFSTRCAACPDLRPSSVHRPVRT